MNSLQKKHVQKGSIFKIELKGNQSTGYRWCLKTLPKSLILVGEDQHADLHLPHMVGYGDTQVFFLKAVENTQVEEVLEFVNMRIRNEDLKDMKVMSYSITVSECDTDVPYQVVNNYFYSGHIPKNEQKYYVFSSLEEFQQVFSPAATMGRQVWLTKQDFKKNIVLAVVEPQKDATTEYRLDAKPFIKNDMLVIDYHTEDTKTPGTEYRFSEILMVSRGDYDCVEFIANGNKVQVPVKEETTA
ncbi:protease inhibitor I42 family protein [Vibrio hepatarius]|uniref:protease inhibitor I42 family protein n=1 Tax=Vibrio hepatarius TaxID=171383 RepID=UPI001C09F469|nr:protease inhibitor I42 family protein [Vibrio hepatarius]MBU2898811.1 protease inhibitor I42 family protein [Vibrio hepatarius]